MMKSAILKNNLLCFLFTDISTVVTNMSQRNLLYISFIIFVTIVHCTPKIPSFLKLCHRNDPHLDKCVKHSVESLKPYLRSGISTLHIPGCEPLKIQKINISQTASSVAIKAIHTDIFVKGSTNYVVKNIKINIDNDQIQVELFFPQLSMTSDYEMTGKILMIAIVGNGRAEGNFSKINADVKIEGLRYRDRISQKMHFSVNDVSVHFKIGHASIYLDNLFNGDKILTRVINTFLNENWKTVISDIKPVLENVIANLFKEYSNKIFLKYPLDELLLP